MTFPVTNPAGLSCNKHPIWSGSPSYCPACFHPAAGDPHREPHARAAESWPRQEKKVGKERGKKKKQPIHLGCLETCIAEGSCQEEAISIRSPCQKSKQAEKVGCAP